MRIFFALFATAFILVSVNSCKQCTMCVKYRSPDIKLCKKDYPSTESYNDVYRQTIGQGYDCE